MAAGQTAAVPDSIVKRDSTGGGAFTSINLSGAPTSANQAANKGYVDSAVSAVPTPTTLSSISGLRLLPKTGNSSALVTGYYTAADGGGGLYTLNTSDTTSSDNGGSIIVAADGGRWYLSNSGVVTTKQFGSKVDGVTNDTSTNQAALNSSATKVIFSPGSSLITSVLALPSNKVIEGDGAIVLWNASSFPNACVGTSNSNLVIKGITFQSSNSVITSATAGVYLITSTNISLNTCNAKNTNLLMTNSSATTYANVVTTGVGQNCCTNIQVLGGSVVGAGSTNQGAGAGITMQYTVGWSVSGISITNSGHGVQWWGGDSNPANNGALTNERKCRQGSVTNITVTNVAGGGVWGSMGYQIAVSGNTISGCLDVGLDSEGCTDITFTGNSVYNCGNGCLTTFWFNTNVAFTGNTVSQPIASQPLGRIFNASGSQSNKSVSFISNTFTCESGVSTLDTASGNVETLVITGNTFANVAISVITNNMRYIKIADNELIFYQVAASLFTAIAAGAITSNGYAQIMGNTVISNVTQPAGSIAITGYQVDYNSTGTWVISGNTTTGFATDLQTTNAGGNGGQTSVWKIDSNDFSSGVYTRVESGAGISTVKLNNNSSRGFPFPSAIPTAGYWNAGQRISLSIPTVQGYSKAICVTAGTPGTWQSYNAVTSLSYYEEYTYSTQIAGPFTIANVNFSITRIGRLVSIAMTSPITIATSSNAVAFTNTTVIPTRFCPTVQTLFPIVVKDVSLTFGELAINSSGAFTISTSSGGGVVSGDSCGFAAFSVSYSIS